MQYKNKGKSTWLDPAAEDGCCTVEGAMACVVGCCGPAVPTVGPPPAAVAVASGSTTVILQSWSLPGTNRITWCVFSASCLLDGLKNIVIIKDWVTTYMQLLAVFYPNFQLGFFAFSPAFFPKYKSAGDRDWFSSPNECFSLTASSWMPSSSFQITAS